MVSPPLNPPSPSSSTLLSLRSTLARFPLRKEQASLEYEANTAYQITMTLGKIPQGDKATQ